jgi:hypothetical protein
MLENILPYGISSTELIKVALIILAGFFFGILAKFLIKKLANKYFYPGIRKNSPSSYKKAVLSINLSINIIEWTIILLFIFQALAIFKIYLFEEILISLVAFLPKFAVAIFIVIIGLLITSILSKEIRSLDFNGSDFVAKIFNIIFIFATILSALEIVNIKLTSFVYVFIACIFSIGLAMALAFGIAFGLALKPEVNKIIKKFNKN